MCVCVCVCVCFQLIRSYNVISIGGVRISEVDPSLKKSLVKDKAFLTLWKSWFRECLSQSRL